MKMYNEKINIPEELRIGVFICDCGSNIAGHLNTKEVTEFAATLPNVVFARNNLYSCSESGIVEIKKAIQEEKLNRVVVASCSPRTHQPLFRASCGEAGLNPYLFEMVNIRDQCSWVHMGMNELATEKAKELVRMGVAKSVYLEPQQDIESDVTPRVLVVGGGVAGLSAAQSLSTMGLEVILVEKTDQLGGLEREYTKIAPEMMDAQAHIADLVATVESLKNVTIYRNTEVTAMDGFIGNFVMTITPKKGDPVEEKIGCIILAIGAVPFVPEGQYGYDGRTVITQMELEQKLRTKTLDAKNIVMIQCVGARTKEKEFCARICCLTAVKNAKIIMEENPDKHVHILYRDMQMYGTQREKMLWDARGEGVRFDVYDPQKPPAVSNGKITFNHAVLGEDVSLDADLVVLSTPLVPRPDALALAQMMRVPVDANGFFLEAHAKLRPLDFASDGIFVCGSTRYPAGIIEARSQGMGVSARVASILFKDKLIIDALVAVVNPKTCAGCLGCLDVCPYNAITFNTEARTCEINRVLCKGCGNCASTCPSQSVQLKGYKPEQLLSQIRAV